MAMIVSKLGNVLRTMLHIAHVAAARAQTAHLRANPGKLENILKGALSSSFFLVHRVIEA
jgi:hypothetical protein